MVKSMKTSKKKKLNSKDKETLEIEFQKAKQRLEEHFSIQVLKLTKCELYLSKDPEEHPYSIYFTQDTSNNYAVHIGIRQTKVWNLVRKKRGDLQKIICPEPDEIEIDIPFCSTSLLNRRLAVTLAARLHNHLLDQYQPCDINFRTHSNKYDTPREYNRKAFPIIFSNRERYEKQNNQPKTTPLASSAP